MCRFGVHCNHQQEAYNPLVGSYTINIYYWLLSSGWYIQLPNLDSFPTIVPRPPQFSYFLFVLIYEVLIIIISGPPVQLTVELKLSLPFLANYDHIFSKIYYIFVSKNLPYYPSFPHHTKWEAYLPAHVLLKTFLLNVFDPFTLFQLRIQVSETYRSTVILMFCEHQKLTLYCCSL